jgi:hyperosmotically inducible protein
MPSGTTLAASAGGDLEIIEKEMTKMKTTKYILALSASVLLFLATSSGMDLEILHARMAEEVRHELAMLPHYSMFDNLVFEIQDVDTIVLSGQVTTPTLKSDAEKAAKGIESVGKLVNKIEVLPLSAMDDRIRIAAYRAIYSQPGLVRYALQAVQPIHIIVKRGHITLTGTVAREMDKILAGIAAEGIYGSFSVTNDLRTEG